MLLDGEDGTNYDSHELGFFKSVLSTAKKVGGGAVKVATTPLTKVTLPAAKMVGGGVLSAVKKVPTPLLAAAAGPGMLVSALALKKVAGGSAPPTNMVQEVTLPSCGFWSRIRRAFGGSVTDCQ